MYSIDRRTGEILTREAANATDAPEIVDPEREPAEYDRLYNKLSNIARSKGIEIPDKRDALSAPGVI
jgi:hypothetical protein